MTELGLKKKTGRITSFDARKGSGRVTIGNTNFVFEVTSFKSARSIRYPSKGEKVEAVLSADGRLVSLWAHDDHA